MKSWRAEISLVDPRERRGTPRWRLQLIVPGGSPSNPGSVFVRDLSETGMSIESAEALTVGERIEVDLPGSYATMARIVWNRDQLYGCEFLSPLPAGIINRTLLQAPLAHPASEAAQELEEFPVAVSPTVEELAHWKADFEDSKGPMGYKLIAFRQMSDGLLIAVAARTGGARA